MALPHLVRRAERLFADHTIAQGPLDGGERMTYGSWAGRVRRLAGALDTLELEPDARVATFATNTIRHLELHFGVPGSGRILHPLNIRLFGAQLGWIIDTAADAAVFCERGLLATLWPVLEERQDIRHVVVLEDGTDDPVPADHRILDYEDLLAAAEPSDLVIADERRAASLCFTTGTTGQPKGVLYSHRATVLHALSMTSVDAVAVGERDTVLPAVPLFHANAWSLPSACVLSGATLVLPGAQTAPEWIARLIADHRVTVGAAVRTVWGGVLELVDAGRADLSSVRSLLCGATPASLLDGFARHGIDVIQGWGMTETHSVATLAVASTGADAATRRSTALTQGRPLALVETRIVDLDTGEELSWDGETPGELQVRGPSIARAYYGTADPATTPDGWLRTGDVATIDRHGFVQLVDRTKDLVKSGGEWIGSLALEQAIAEHPAVDEVAVVGVPSERWGERPVAFVVPASGETAPGVEELRDFLVARVARWWVPDAVHEVGSLPHNTLGKVDKQRLRMDATAMTGDVIPP